MQLYGYKEFEHTADIAIEVWGESLDNLFRAAAEGMYFLIFEDQRKNGTRKEEIHLESDSIDQLLVDFLSELNYHILVKQNILCPILNLDINEHDNVYKLECTANSSILSEKSLKNMTEIKSVTYHKLHVRHQNYAYRTKIIFDI